MSITLEELQAGVLSLSKKDRARLLDRLIASLDADVDADVEAEAAWDAVADTRERELESDDARALPLQAAVARLEACFPG